MTEQKKPAAAPKHLAASAAAKKTETNTVKKSASAGSAQTKTASAAKRTTPAKRRVSRSKKNGLKELFIAKWWVLAVAAFVILDVILVISAITKSNAKPIEKVDYSDYPVAYTDLIAKYAEPAGLENAYVASVILAESSYDPQAVSSVDARGLMQILPSTAQWIASKLGETYTDEALFDPETNIRYGCWYLGYLMDRYNGDMRCSSAAYHAGQGTVDGWLADSTCSANGVTLDVIPGAQTSNYVEKIMRYYSIYEELLKQAA